ncbi:MAG TPA: hypothetical protein VF398_09070 [bacterium]|jgi:hypothetical protein
MMKKRFVGLVFALGVIGCSREPFNGLSYTSFREGDQYQFSGMPIRWEVQNETETQRGVEFVLVGRDSLGNELMKQYYLRQSDRLLWRGVDGAALGMTRFHFDPGLWACPFSDQIGETLSYTNVEYRDEPMGLRLRIKVDSVIEALEDVQTKVGRFEKCIKVRANVIYLDPTSSPFFSGDAVWWFAKDIGVVKSQMPEGESELVFAQIGERFWP